MDYICMFTLVWRNSEEPLQKLSINIAIIHSQYMKEMRLFFYISAIHFQTRDTIYIYIYIQQLCIYIYIYITREFLLLLLLYDQVVCEKVCSVCEWVVVEISLQVLLSSWEAKCACVQNKNMLCIVCVCVINSLI